MIINKIACMLVLSSYMLLVGGEKVSACVCVCVCVCVEEAPLLLWIVQ